MVLLAALPGLELLRKCRFPICARRDSSPVSDALEAVPACLRPGRLLGRLFGRLQVRLLGRLEGPLHVAASSSKASTSELSWPTSPSPANGELSCEECSPNILSMISLFSKHPSSKMPLLLATFRKCAMEQRAADVASNSSRDCRPSPCEATDCAPPMPVRDNGEWEHMTR